MKSIYIVVLSTLVCLQACGQSKGGDTVKATSSKTTSSEKKNQSQFPVVKTEQEWRAQLSPEAYYVLREKGTERAFANPYWKNKKKGTYHCGGCGEALFSSATKYDSGTGWPSFFKPLTAEKVVEIEDKSIGMVRAEAVCARCGSHLGHIFEDGPKPTGLRYCLNSVALHFKQE